MDPQAANLPDWPADAMRERYGIVPVPADPDRPYAFQRWPIDEVVARWAETMEVKGAVASAVHQRLAAMPSERYHWLFGAWPDLDPSRLVYHYTKPRHLAAIASSQSLRLGPMHQMNDPREFEPWAFEAWWSQNFGAAGATTPLTERANRFRRNSKLTCFGADWDPDLVRIPIKDRMSGEMRRRGYLRPRMWDQYGEGHTGVCFILDRDALDDRIDRHLRSASVAAKFPESKVFSGYVKYTDSTIDAFPATVLGQVNARGFNLTDVIFDEEFIRAGFLMKDPDWETEREYRWGLVTDLDGPGTGEIFVPAKGLIVGIVAGLRFDESTWAADLSSCVDAFDVPANVAAVRWSDNRLGLSLVPG